MPWWKNGGNQTQECGGAKGGLLTEIAIGREATPADVAAVVAWFVSPDAGYVTGQSLQVDGEWDFTRVWNKAVRDRV